MINYVMEMNGMRYPVLRRPLWFHIYIYILLLRLLLLLLLCIYIYILYYCIYIYYIILYILYIIYIYYIIYIDSRHCSISKVRRFALLIFTSVAIVTPALWSGFLLTLCIKLYDSLPCYIIQTISSINNLHQFNLIVRFVPNNILCFTVFSNGSSSTK